MLKRYLGLSEEEIVENEKLWKEERDEPALSTTQGQDLRSIGITPAGLESDIQTGQDLSGLQPMGAEAGITGGAPGTQPGAPGLAPTGPGAAAPPAV